MPTYKVKLTYKYSDTIEVEADNRAEAIERALASEDIDEQFECLHDAEVVG